MPNLSRRRLLGHAAAVPLAMMATQSALAQASAYPSGPVTMIIPYAAGGATDVMGRAIAQKLADKWGKPVVVENRPGSSGMIGARLVGRAKPDGQTLLFSLSSLIQAPHLFPSQNFATVIDELAPISMTGTNYLLWIVRSDFPARDLKQLVAMVRAEPAKYGSFGSYGAGTTGHIMGLIFAQAAKLSLNHVPYRGEPPEIADLLGGHIPMAVVSGNGAKAQLDAGKIRVLATTGTERSLLTPDVPTFKEQGYNGMELAGWSGMFAPRGTSPDLIARISRDVNEALTDQALIRQFREIDIRLVGTTPELFGSEIKRQYDMWGKTIRDAGVKGE